MGITKLADLIRTDAKDAISYKEISDYTGKVIALDTSILVNQFRAATPSLSPLTGLFFRTLTFLEHDIKPVFVFDGTPPSEKTAVLQKRREAHGFQWTSCSGTASPQTKDCLQLLKLMGVPVIQAPADAEAMCAWLVREKKVDAVASEDMDSLPFGASVLIRQLNAKKASEVIEYSLPKLLEVLQISHEEFVDLCILLGCDYCDKITGLGPKRALTLIKQHRTIENVVLHIKRKTHPVPQFWGYREARKIFLEGPEATAPELTWTEPDEEALVGFLCHTKRVKCVPAASFAFSLRPTRLLSSFKDSCACVHAAGVRVCFSENRIRHRMERFRQTRQSNRQEREEAREEGRYKQTCIKDFFRVNRKRNAPVETTESSDTKKQKSK